MATKKSLRNKCCVIIWEAFTCVPLKKMPHFCVPLKSWSSPTCHRSNFSFPSCHSVGILLGVDRLAALTCGTGLEKYHPCPWIIAMSAGGAIFSSLSVLWLNVRWRGHCNEDYWRGHVGQALDHCPTHVHIFSRNELQRPCMHVHVLLSTVLWLNVLLLFINLYTVGALVRCMLFFARSIRLFTCSINFDSAKCNSAQHAC